MLQITRRLCPQIANSQSVTFAEGPLRKSNKLFKSASLRICDLQSLFTNRPLLPPMKTLPDENILIDDVSLSTILHRWVTDSFIASCLSCMCCTMGLYYALPDLVRTQIRLSHFSFFSYYFYAPERPFMHLTG